LLQVRRGKEEQLLSKEGIRRHRKNKKSFGLGES